MKHYLFASITAITTLAMIIACSSSNDEASSSGSDGATTSSSSSAVAERHRVDPVCVEWQWRWCDDLHEAHSAWKIDRHSRDERCAARSERRHARRWHVRADKRSRVHDDLCRRCKDPNLRAYTLAIKGKTFEQVVTNSDGIVSDASGDLVNDDVNFSATPTCQEPLNADGGFDVIQEYTFEIAGSDAGADAASPTRTALKMYVVRQLGSPPSSRS